MATGLLCILYVWLGYSQSYVSALGLRMGTDFGVTLQQKILPKVTVQGLVSSSPGRSETTATVLLQSHQPLLSKRFNFFLGGGFHTRWIDSIDASSMSTNGITAVAGAEMTFGRLNISWDYKPMYHLNTSQGSFENETAVSLRYVFIKKNKRKGKNGILRRDKADQKHQKRKKKKRLKKKLQRQKQRNLRTAKKFKMRDNG